MDVEVVGVVESVVMIDEVVSVGIIIVVIVVCCRSYRTLSL